MITVSEALKPTADLQVKLNVIGPVFPSLSHFADVAAPDEERLSGDSVTAQAPPDSLAQVAVV